MEERHERQRPAIPGIVSMSFGIIMVVLYVTLGTTIIFSTARIPNIPPLYAKLFGILLILYGGFRGYKVYRKHFSDPNPD